MLTVPASVVSPIESHIEQIRRWMDVHDVGRFDAVNVQATLNLAVKE